MNKYLIVIGLLIVSFGGQAQSVTLSTKSKKAKELYIEAEQSVQTRKFDVARELLLKAIKKDPDFAEAHLRLGLNYRLFFETENAKKYLSRYVQLMPQHKQTAGILNILADMYLENGEYAQAKQALEQFVAHPDALPEQINNAKHKIQNCEFAVEAIKMPLPISLERLPANINRFQMQYFPALTADEQIIIYTARKTLSPQSDEDIYVAQKMNGEWSAPASISDNINTNFNEGTSSVSADGKVLVFTACAGRKSAGSCDLYISYRTGDQWSVPKPLAGVNSPHWDTQPSLSADGKTLYFTSDRPGGLGKSDIWVTYENEKGEWENPVNLGSPINTTDEEYAPFIHANGQTLFFSSKGHIGFGNLDIYLSNLTNTGWSKPQNLGYPLNSFNDESSLFVSADGKTAYYSIEKRVNNQPVSSLLYTFKIPASIGIPHVSNYVKGKVYDAETKQPLAATVELIDNVVQKPIYTVRSDSVTGRYLMVLTEGSRYGLYVNKPGYLFKSLYFDYAQTDVKNSVVVDIALNKTKTGEKTTLNNIFFESGQYHILPQSIVELKKVIAFLKDNPMLKIEIEGHTDNVGKIEDNKLLSERRAKAVADYLAQNKIAPDRIRYKGYGETQPVAPNTDDENRQMNRRIAFKVL